MKNKYILILSTNEITKRVYKRQLKTENYDIIADDGNMLFAKQTEIEQTNLKYERYLIDITISIIKKYRIDKFVYMDLTNVFNEIMNKISNEEGVKPIDNRITWAIRQEIVKILANRENISE